MNENKSGGKATSSEDGISSISLDPSLTAEGIGGLGGDYSSPLDDIHVQARILGGHAAERVIDPNDQGAPVTIAGK